MYVVTALFVSKPRGPRASAGPLPARLALRGVRLSPRDGREALDALALVSSRLHAAGDPRAAFPEVYAVITRRVLVEVERERSAFLEPRWVDRLMGRFCARYLETLDRSLRGLPQDCEAWRLAHDLAAAGLTVPMQEVLLGVNAHVNHDLAPGTAETIAEDGGAPDRARLARYKHDYDHVNELLRESLAECVARVRDRYGCRATSLVWRVARPLVGPGCLAAVAAWRAHAWGDVLRLLGARSGEERRAVMRGVERRAGRIGRSIAGMSAGLALGRAVLPAGADRALRGLLMGAHAAGEFRSLLDLEATTAAGVPSAAEPTCERGPAGGAAPDPWTRALVSPATLLPAAPVLRPGRLRFRARDLA